MVTRLSGNHGHIGSAAGTRAVRGRAARGGVRWLVLAGGLLALSFASGCTITNLQREVNSLRRRNVELLQDRDGLERNLNVAKGEQDALKSRLTDLTLEVQRLRAEVVEARSSSGLAGGPAVDLAPVGAGEMGEAVPAMSGVVRGPTGFEGLVGLGATRGSGGEVRVVLAQAALFGAGQATVSEAGGAILDRVAGVLGAGYRGHAVRVEGHTDNVPVSRVKARYPSNWELSTARAAAVLRGLAERQAVEPGQARVVGWADTRPLASNDTEEGRKTNRRVEIVVAPRPGGG